MDLLITGGTAFVSRYAAQFFARRGENVTVLNRGSRPQPDGVTSLIADRMDLGDCLRGRRFDAVLDITAYTAEHVKALLDAGVRFDDYILSAPAPSITTGETVCLRRTHPAAKTLCGANTARINGKRSYFCFHDYAYYPDVSRMASLMPDTLPLDEEIGRAYKFYRRYPDSIYRRNPYLVNIAELNLRD